MKRLFAKAAAITMIAALSMGVTACGDSSKDSDKTSASSASSASGESASGSSGSQSGSSAENIPNIPGKIKSYYQYSSVLVPDGWVLQPVVGTLVGDEDPRHFYLKKDGVIQLDIHYGGDLEGEMKSLKQKLDYNFKAEIEDLPRGNGVWNGIIYEQDGKTIFEVYGTAGLTACHIKSDTLDFYSDEAKAVMASIYIEDTSTKLA